MILPTKHLPIERSLLAGGATVLDAVRTPVTVSQVWEAVRNQEAVGSFDRFVLALDFLFALDLLSLDENRLSRSPR